jgi:hypothetical protein
VKSYTVQCFHTGYVTIVNIEGDHVAACVAHRDRMLGLGFAFPGRHRYRAHEFPGGELRLVTLPDGLSSKM